MTYRKVSLLLAFALVAQLTSDSASDRRDQPWKAFVSEPKISPDQSLFEMVKVGGAINFMTKLLYAQLYLSLLDFYHPGICLTVPSKQVRRGRRSTN